jgi:2-C-methyl-D-erythritol 4-phosphate cytidylyltransferase
MASGYVEQVRAMLADGGYGKVTGVIAGGATRPDSTRVALAALAGAGRDPADCGVLLHDAARPLVDQRIIADCVAALGCMRRPGWRCRPRTPSSSPTTA